MEEGKIKLSQGDILELLVQSGKWRDLDPRMFSNVPTLIFESAREAAFDRRLNQIGLELTQLHQFEMLFDNDRETLERIKGDKHVLRTEVADIFRARYPHVEPKQLDKNESLIVDLTQDTNAAIQFFVGMGEVEALDPEILPALKHLKAETLLELKIDALQSKLARYREWKALPMDEQLGLQNRSPNKKSELDQLSEVLIKETINHIELLAKERRALLKKKE